MRRRTLIAALSAALLSALVVGPTQVAAAETTPIADRAFAQIQGCVSDPEAQLNVLYVVDESGSLTETDPDGVRAEAIAQSFGQLAKISESRTVYTSIAMFAEGYRVERPWQALTPESARKEAEWARSTVGGLVGGQATNWLAALQGAADSMDSSPDSSAACKVVVWMTDGAINVPSADGTTSADVDALAEICASDPGNGDPIDQSPVIARLRTSGVNLIGVLLKAGTTDEQQRAVMTYMRPIVEGVGEVDPGGFWIDAPGAFEFNCGQSPIPENQAAGAFIEADDPLDLARKFSEMFICIVEPCEPLPPTNDSFLIDEGVGYFYVLAAGDSWTLSGPGGSPFITPETQGDGISISAAGDLRTVEVRGGSVATGTWTIENAIGESTIFVFSGLEMNLEAAERFSGEQTELRFSLTRDDIPLKSLAAYQPTSLKATASQPGKDDLTLQCSQDVNAASFVCPFTPSQVGSVSIRAELPLTTIGGTSFPPVVYQTSLRVQPTPDYPQVREPEDGSGVHQLTALVGRRGAAQGSLVLEGPGRGDGEICFPDSTGIAIDVDPQPERIESYSVSGLPAGCVAVTQGSTTTVSFSVANPVSATGTVEGSFVVTLKSASRSEEATQEVTFAFSSERKADPPSGLLIGLGLIALALPLGLLYLQSIRAARLDLR